MTATTTVTECTFADITGTPDSHPQGGDLNLAYSMSLPVPQWNDPIMLRGPDEPIHTRIAMRMVETSMPCYDQRDIWKCMKVPRTLVTAEHENAWEAWARLSHDPDVVEELWRKFFGPDVPAMTAYDLRAIIANTYDRLLKQWREELPPPSVTDCYDPVRGRYLRKDRKGHWNSYILEQYRRRLFRLGRHSDKGPGGAPSQVESDIDAVTERQATITVGMSGFQSGLHYIEDRLYLARYGYEMIKPNGKITPWKTLRWLQEMLGEDGMHRVIDWLHHAVTELLAGRRGQSRILALAGTSNCGKSLLIREFIRLLLGGRAADAAPWLLGTTDFASELGGAELLYVDDALGDGRLTTRLGVASRQKQIVTAGSKPQPMHAKGKDRYYHPVWWRHAVALNDTPEALAMLPPLDEGYSDKLILLRANDTVLSAGGDGAAAYIEAMFEELPGFMAYIIDHGCKGPSDGRGPLAWQDPELAGRLREAAPEYSLAGMIAEALERGDTYGMLKKPMIDPTLRELDRALRDTCGDRYSKLCVTDRATRKYLTRLQREGAVKSRLLDGRTRWSLDKINAWLESHQTCTDA